MTLAPGARLGHYQVAAKIGAGGMGEVWRAHDSKLGRDVALKVLPAEMATNPDRLERFQREARALAALDHLGIVTVHSVEEADGVHFLTMQLVDGQPLDRIIPAGGLPIERVLAIAAALADALAAAHERGIVHRDLKPANVMVSGDGRVKVLDFGLAKVTEADAETEATVSHALTQAGAVMGTMPYMSPEQVSGRPVDHRTDIFALGVILYEMASGRRPFRSVSSAELASEILRDAPPPLTSDRGGLPDGLLRTVARCLQKDPGARFQSMREAAAALQALPAAGTGPAIPGGRGPRLRQRRLAIACGVAVLLAAAAYLASRTGLRRSGEGGLEVAGAPRTIRSLAVLPLDNYSGDPGQDYFAEGMTDELTTDLATIGRLRVISRGSAMQFKGANRPPTPEIGKALNVDAIVEGSVLRVGDKVRITAQLIDARSDEHLWAKSFERSSSDVLALQAELASAIAGEIHVTLTPTERSRLASARTVDPDAYDAYLKGRYFFNRANDENLQKAIARFEEAIAMSPAFASAHSGLSDAYLWAGYNEGFLTATEARPKAKAAALEAVRLDDQSAEAHASLATFMLFYEYDWEACETEYRRAIALNPSYAFAHDQFSLALAFQGRFEEAIAEADRAGQLDPLNPQIPIDATVGLAFSGKYQEAREQARRAAEIDPTYFFSPVQVGWINLQEGRIADAIPEFRKAKAMDAPPFVSAWLGYAYAASGDRTRALAELEDLKRRALNGVVPPFSLALVSLGLGEHARAVSLLEQAYASDSQWLGWLKNDRTFDPLRSDPRFQALIRKLRFPR